MVSGMGITSPPSIISVIIGEVLVVTVIDDVAVASLTAVTVKDFVLVDVTHTFSVMVVRIFDVLVTTCVT